MCYGWHIIELAKIFLDSRQNLSSGEIKTQLIDFEIKQDFIAMLKTQVIKTKH